MVFKGLPGLPGLPSGYGGSVVGQISNPVTTDIRPKPINENYPAGFIVGPPGPKGERVRRVFSVYKSIAWNTLFVAVTHPACSNYTYSEGTLNKVHVWFLTVE